MDTTNRYAVMCLQAGEIQAMWQPQQCDFFIDRADCEENIGFCTPAAGMIQVVNFYYDESAGERFEEERREVKDQSIWLPRQDQLQVFIEPDREKVHNVLPRVLEALYFDYSAHATVSAPSLFYSMEQLWLAFVMRERFGKVWNEETWIAERKSE